MFLVNKVPSVFVVVSLVLLANAQKTSNSLRDVELARQNVITKQILEAFIQKKLGLSSTNLRAPSIFDILPMKKTEDRTTRQSSEHNSSHLSPETSEEQDLMDDPDMLEDSEDSEISDDLEGSRTRDMHYGDDDGLQSVESEQIDSIYSEGRSKKYTSQSYEGELEPSYRKQII